MRHLLVGNIDVQCDRHMFDGTSIPMGYPYRWKERHNVDVYSSFFVWLADDRCDWMKMVVDGLVYTINTYIYTYFA